MPEDFIVNWPLNAGKMNIFFKKIWSRIQDFFVLINYPILGNSFVEVLCLAVIAILPLSLAVFIFALPDHKLNAIFLKTITPGEIIALSLSFTAPTLYFFIKTHGSEYKLPWKKLFFILTIVVYLLSAVISVLAKKGLVKGIDMKEQDWNLYYSFSITFLIAALVIWLYRTYHDKNSLDWTLARERAQQSANASFKDSINNQVANP
jgi:hypothetical protein